MVKHTLYRLIFVATLCILNTSLPSPSLVEQGSAEPGLAGSEEEWNLFGNTTPSSGSIENVIGFESNSDYFFDNKNAYSDHALTDHIGDFLRANSTSPALSFSTLLDNPFSTDDPNTLRRSPGIHCELNNFGDLEALNQKFCASDHMSIFDDQTSDVPDDISGETPQLTRAEMVAELEAHPWPLAPSDMSEEQLTAALQLRNQFYWVHCTQETPEVLNPESPNNV